MKMAITFTRFDPADFIQSPGEIAAYLQACIEEDSGDGELFRKALSDISRVQVLPPATSADRHATDQVSIMAYSRNVFHTIIARISRDPEFARALQNEAATLFRNGEPELAHRILHLLIKALRHHTARRFFTYGSRSG
ncbi:DNA-binding protein [Pseudomonas sp. NPDC087697]|uniref:helix-turn-helix domain-containing transcriptional regulator n=1 Tax=Pseudomonas sp. NPDC087697 TaxID=3364447 RepID=UPI0037F14F3B